MSLVVAGSVTRRHSEADTTNTSRSVLLAWTDTRIHKCIVT